MSLPLDLRRLVSLPAAALVLVVGLGGCRRSNAPAPFPNAPIVLVSIDTLRADRLPAWGYRGVSTPALDALASEGVVFENAYSHYPLTFPSHVSMLTGLLPPRHGVRDNDGYRFDPTRHPFLPRLLAAAGYATGGFVSSLVLRTDTGLGGGFDVYDDGIAHRRGAPFASAQRPGPETATHALEWLAARAGRPTFLFLHLYEPHAPYAPPEPFRSRHPQAPYEGEIEAADAIVGGLVARLRKLELFDRAVFVVTSDHGEGLGDHSEMSHGYFLYRSTMHVPLIVRWPGNARAGTRIARPVGLVDLAPTLAALVGAAVPQGLDGRDLFAEPAPDEPARSIYAETYHPRLHLGWSDLQALYESRWSYVDAPDPELYDLVDDPAQTRNVFADNRREQARMRALARKLDAPIEAPFPVDRETADQLAALGYLTSPAVLRVGELPDPKSQIEQLRALEAGQIAGLEGRHEDAIRHFRRLLELNDQMLDSWAKLAASLAELGRYQEAIPALRRALDLSGGDPRYALQLAESLLRLGDLDEARRLVDLMREERPQDADDVLAQIDLAEGRTAEAFARMEQAAAEGRATEGMAHRLALSRLAEGRSQEAVKLLEPFVADGEIVTVATYARALSDLGRHEEALAELERAATPGEAQPALDEANGIILLRLGRAREARVALERAVAASPRLASAWNTLGVAIYQLEGAVAAIPAWQKATALDPELWDAQYNLGLVAADIGDRALARRVLASYVAKAPPATHGAEIAKARALLARLSG